MEDDYYDSADVTDFSDCEDEIDTLINVNVEGLDKWIPPLFYLAKNLLQDVAEEKQNLKNLCIACWASAGKQRFIEHPFFEGCVCRPCKQRLMHTMFAKFPRGDHAYCVICGAKSNSSKTCTKVNCMRNFCVNCLNIWTDETELILERDDWFCLICEPNYSLPLIPHYDWLQRVLMFHEPLAAYAPRAVYWTKQPLRILSLFDGIGTGLVALRKLGIEVEVYYASEVLAAAATVSRTRLGGVLKHIGSVGEVTHHRLEEIAPIHLLIGGSPCNDFSAINRFPKDFYDPRGYSRYFFDFTRVLELLRKLNGNQRHLLWLFENVASMPQHYQDTISRHLGCEPAVIDAKHFSPQSRRRLFWGNIPGLFTVNSNQLSSNGESFTLEKSLMPNSGRRATQTKIRTLTTNTNSLLQGRTENCFNRRELTSLFPVRFVNQTADDIDKQPSTSGLKKNKRKHPDNHEIDNSDGIDDLGSADVLWLQEIEHVFGLPRHFTDVGNISRTDRQKLLGHAWSVPVIVSIFSHLRNYAPVVTLNSHST